MVMLPKRPRVQNDTGARWLDSSMHCALLAVLVHDIAVEYSWLSLHMQSLRQASRFYDLPPDLTKAVHTFFLYRFYSQG